MLIDNYKKFLKTLPTEPGVYRMYDKADNILYVGKAKNLKKRVTSYFRPHLLDPKTESLMTQVAKVEVTIVDNEREALLLESNFIKQFKPHYNILFKDDKSYPYLVLTNDPIPRLFIYRGARRIAGEFFGPYSNVGAVHHVLALVRKIFAICSCKNKPRGGHDRLCLHHQFKHSALFKLDNINAEDYQENVNLLRQLLRGKNQMVIKLIQKKMRKAAGEKKYELAAEYRDQILSLRELLVPQRIAKRRGDVDVVALVQLADAFCLQTLLIRNGAIIGGRSYFPTAPKFSESGEVLSAFLIQHYLNIENYINPPKMILTNIKINDHTLLQKMLIDKWQASVKILTSGEADHYKSWMQMAEANAFDALRRYLAVSAEFWNKFYAHREALQLKDLPKRIECFDISHSAGEATTAACVVFALTGPLKSDYRKFNIEGIKPNDDYGSLNQALNRHFANFKLDPNKMPFILLIDGGRGQLNIAREVLRKLKIDGIILMAIAKDPNRKKGKDVIFRLVDDDAIIVPVTKLALHLLQQIRDETHRFAVTSHRKRFIKTRHISVLQNIPGIGPRKAKILLQHFGGLQEIQEASLEELTKVQGINQALAQAVYQYFHQSLSRTG